jgi:hypothetical protein
LKDGRVFLTNHKNEGARVKDKAGNGTGRNHPLAAGRRFSSADPILREGRLLHRQGRKEARFPFLDIIK